MPMVGFPVSSHLAAICLHVLASAILVADQLSEFAIVSLATSEYHVDFNRAGLFREGVPGNLPTNL